MAQACKTGKCSTSACMYLVAWFCWTLFAKDSSDIHAPSLHHGHVSGVPSLSELVPELAGPGLPLLVQLLGRQSRSIFFQAGTFMYMHVLYYIYIYRYVCVYSYMYMQICGCVCKPDTQSAFEISQPPIAAHPTPYPPSDTLLTRRDQVWTWRRERRTSVRRRSSPAP